MQAGMSSISDIVLYRARMGTILTFGEWLDDRLRERRLTQTEFAALLDTSQSTVNAWVNNASRPTRRNVRAIADALSVDREEVHGRLEGTWQAPPALSTPATNGIDLSDPLTSFSAVNQHRLTARQKQLLIELAREWLASDDAIDAGA